MSFVDGNRGCLFHTEPALCGYCSAFDRGAAVAFGLMGMAEAIGHAEEIRERFADQENHDCTCPASWGADFCSCAVYDLPVEPDRRKA